MKSATTFFFCLTVIIFNTYAQSGTNSVDPFMGKYVLNKSSELMIQYQAKYLNWLTNRHHIFDVVSNKLTSVEQKSQAINSVGETALATGDIDGDYKDEVISCRSSGYSIEISIPDIAESTLKIDSGTTITLNSVLKSSMRIITADLDDDPKEEVILAYHGLDDKLHILLYQVNENNTFEKTTEIAEMPLVDYIPEGTTLDPKIIFEITAGDFDGDGLDELVAMNVLSSKNDIVIINTHVYKFNQSEEKFILTEAAEIENHSFAVPHDLIINEMAVTTGDFDRDGLEEVAYALEGLDVEYEFTKYINRRAAKGGMFEIGQQLDTVYHDVDKKYEIDWRTEYSAIDNPLIEGFTLSLCSGDLNNDGQDELVGLGSNWLTVIQYDTEKQEFNQVGGHIVIPAEYDFNGHNLLAVENIDSDTVGRDYSIWYPEIVVAGNSYSAELNSSTFQLFVVKPELGPDNSISDFSISQEISTTFDLNKIQNMVLALGDFDGDGLMVGPPKDISRPSTLIPSIILNAPPSHFDILNNQVYDVNFYQETEAATRYSDESTSETTISTQMQNSWGLSSEISVGGSFLGASVSASINTDYSETFSNSQTQTNTVSITSTNSARIDDKIHGISTDFHLLEYPVFYNHQFTGNMLVSIPNPPFDKTWKESTSLTPNTYSLVHEPGNLLSYPDAGEITFREDYLDKGSYRGLPFTELSTKPSASYGIKFSELTGTSIEEYQEFGIGMEVSASGWGCSASFRGDYSESSLVSHTTYINDAFDVTFEYGSIDKSIGEVEYEVKPIVYWSRKGALVVDYEVKLIGNWWNDRYGQKPDPAFIMPFRYGPEKGINFKESKRMMTSDIRYFPYDALPGDTVDILATVRNFSLKDLNDDVKVLFYLGSPDFGGTLISDLDGNSEFYVSEIKSRKSKEIQFRWATPSEIPEDPWIFAVIDPDDAVDEIHSNNNMGFVPLFMAKEYPPYVQRTETITSLQELQEPMQLSNYPNPARSETTIRFYLDESCNVDIQIFDTHGKKIEQKDFIEGKKGLNEIYLSTSAYNPGVYFYLLNTGTSLCGNKLIVN